jgi:hypothetical protein
MVGSEPMEGLNAALASLIHYATIYVLIITPYNLIAGKVPMSVRMMLSVGAYVAWAGVSYFAAYIVLTMPPILPKSSVDSLDIALSDSDKCLTELGDFMTLLATALGERRQIEKLWGQVFAYLKDDNRIRKLVLNNRLKHDEIALNAVGSIAFKLLSEGDLHAAYGTLSPDGEYVRKVWWVTANELVRRSYYRPEDVTQGIEAVDAAIVSASPKP